VTDVVAALHEMRHRSGTRHLQPGRQ
jgi:hypothetical protein